MDVWQYPTSCVTEHYHRLFFSCRFGNFVQNSLFHYGFLFSFFVSHSKRRIKILALTEKGEKVLGMSQGKSDRHGGPEHRYWSRVLADHLKSQGYDVAEEVPIGGGKTIDIVATRDGKRIAFEIETGKSDVVANVRKCLDADLDRVIVVAISDQVRRVLARAVWPSPHTELLTGPELLHRLDPLQRTTKPA